jgi:lipopolysaccharide transport system permease protein
MTTTDRFRGLGSSLPELRAQRELLGVACRRHLTNKYRRSAIGVGWVLLTPLLTALVMFAVFNTLFSLQDTGGWPFLAYVYSGIGMFGCFQQTALDIAPTLRSNAGILTRTGAAPEIFVLSSVVTGLVGLCASTLIVTAILVAYGAAPGISLVLLPVALLAIGSLSLGVGAFLAHVSIQYEDVSSISAVGLTVLGYLTPTFYPVSIIPHDWRGVYQVNPLVSLLDIHREALGATPTVDWPVRAYAITLSIVVGVGALHSFRRRWPRVVTEL